MEINDVSGQVVDAAMKVHSVLGPGLLETAYKACLAYELRTRGLAVRREVLVRVHYDGVDLDVDYRIDMLVEECVDVETKTVAKIIPVHEAQLLSQLKLGDYRVGLLINFNAQRRNRSQGKSHIAKCSASPRPPRLRVKRKNPST
jgi:GxxExxY protein